MQPTHIVRTRWAAIGAALAVAVGAGGVGLIQATSPAGASTYIPIVPCRLADTRPDSPVGPHTTPLGPDHTATYDAWGDLPGDCNLPTNTTGLQLNVTAVDATTLTNLRLYPTGQPTPTASNLNPAPNQPPTPNAVTVTLNPTTGQFDVFNRFGHVHIVIDALGYYTDHHHDDRYPLAEDVHTKADVYTKAEVDDLVAPPDPLPIQPHLLDLQPFPASAWSLVFGWAHDSADPTGCLVAPVVALAETRINTATIGYLAPVDGELDVEIVSMRTTPGIGGPPLTTFTFTNYGHPVAWGSEVLSTVVTHDINDVPPSPAVSGPIPGPGYDSFLRICTDSTITIRSVELTYQ